MLVNRRLEDESLPAVTVDDHEGARLAVEHVVALGHRRSPTSAARRSCPPATSATSGSSPRWRPPGIEVDPSATRFAQAFTEAAGARVCRELLDEAPDITAIVAANDLLALGCYDVLAERGLRCPEDVSVVGFNDMPFADRFDPPLTTVADPAPRDRLRRRRPAARAPGRDGGERAAADPAEPDVRCPRVDRAAPLSAAFVPSPAEAFSLDKTAARPLRSQSIAANVCNGVRRRGMRRLRWCAPALAAAALLAAGCGGSDNGGGSGSDSSKPIRIGASLPLTGDFSEPGKAAQQGYQVWQKMVNDQGGLLGRKVQVVVRDDASDQNTVVSDYNALISRQKVDMLLGTFSSLLNLPASTVAERNRKLYVEPAGGAPEIFSRGYKHLFFAQQATADHQGDVFAEYILSLPPSERPKTAAYPSLDDPFALPVAPGTSVRSSRRRASRPCTRRSTPARTRTSTRSPTR